MLGSHYFLGKSKLGKSKKNNQRFYRINLNKCETVREGFKEHFDSRMVPLVLVGKIFRESK